MKTRITLFVLALVMAIGAIASTSAFADGGPIFTCPPKAKNCECTLPSCK